MNPRIFEIILISGSIRIVRRIAAHSAVAATRIGINLMAHIDAPCTITCNRAHQIYSNPASRCTTASHLWRQCE